VQSDISKCVADGVSGVEPARTHEASDSLAAGGDPGNGAAQVLRGENEGVGGEGLEGASGGTKPLHGEQTVE